MCSYYDVALVCLNGHVINENVRDNPAHNATHCARCGEKTISKCPSCNSDIRGSYEVPGVCVFGGGFEAPAFCHECGKPYPWTAERLAAAKELANEFEELSADEKTKLQDSLDDLVKETPRTEVSGLRFKKIMKKVGKDSYDGMKSILTDIASETLKKAMFGE